MTDLIEQLRGMGTYGYQSQLACEAADQIERLTAELAESKKQIGSYKTLTKALEEQVSHHRRLSERYQESIKTMQSERDANAILTAELAERQKDRDELITQLQKSEKDAARYRHMRNNSQFQSRNGPGLYWYLPRMITGTKGERLDASIDQAMKEAKP